MASVTRSKDSVYLLSYMKESLSGAKLPSIGDVMRLYLHNLKMSATTKHEAATQTIDELELFWNRARIPMRPRHHAVEQLEGLMSKWEKWKKNKGRRTETQAAKEEAVTEIFCDLFDIAHQNALSLIKVEEDKEFLLPQREKGRKGAMIGVDVSLVKKEAEMRHKQEKRCKWEEKKKAELGLFNQRIT